MAMDPRALVEQLRAAVDAHDIERIVSCFSPDFRNETPAHPGRSFRGGDQVRANWTRILAGIPDVTATVFRTAVEGDIVWSEWELKGTRVDGARQVLRGVVIFAVAGTTFAWNRFYLEPVDEDDDGVHTAVGRLVEPVS
jgi:ketosteroid isomerase-like protein